MNESSQVIVSSVSNCLEKNGVVTFMAILHRHSRIFYEHGVQLDFANYVDFPAPAQSIEPAPAAPESTAANTPSLVRRCLQATKYAIKEQFAKRPLGAFLLMMGTLSRRALVAVIKARLREGPNCLHFHQDIFCAFFGQRLLSRNSRKLLLLHAGHDPLHQVFIHFRGMRGTRYETRIRAELRHLLGRLDGIVTLNERYASKLRSEFPGLDIRCIYNTSPFAGGAGSSHDGGRQMDKRQDRLRVLAVGSLQYIKGFDLLINAAADLEEADRRRLHITIVGGGADRAPLQAIIDAQGLQDVVTLNGESDNVASFLARADTYILTSRDEGFPIALIEASSFGLPIVSTRVGSIPEVFDEGSCMFIEANVDSIRDALLGLSRGTVDLCELARRSRSVFDAKLSLDAFLGAYCRLFTEHGRVHAR